jgi:hypothetical protein
VVSANPKPGQQFLLTLSESRLVIAMAGQLRQLTIFLGINLKTLNVQNGIDFDTHLKSSKTD